MSKNELEKEIELNDRLIKEIGMDYATFVVYRGPYEVITTMPVEFSILQGEVGFDFNKEAYITKDTLVILSNIKRINANSTLGYPYLVYIEIYNPQIIGLKQSMSLTLDTFLRCVKVKDMLNKN